MNHDLSAHLPLHPRDFLILFVLVDGELHGYGLVKAIEEESEGDVRMDPANLYRSLRRLERDGLVVESEGEGDVERRRCYGLTALGRRVVAAEAARVSRLVRRAHAKKLIPSAKGQR
jgi:DNA-binding PadR family transcriptional regulator